MEKRSKALIHLRLAPRVLKVLDDVAAEARVTRSEALRQALNVAWTHKSEWFDRIRLAEDEKWDRPSDLAPAPVAQASVNDNPWGD